MTELPRQVYMYIQVHSYRHRMIGIESRIKNKYTYANQIVGMSNGKSHLETNSRVISQPFLVNPNPFLMDQSTHRKINSYLHQNAETHSSRRLWLRSQR